MLYILKTFLLTLHPGTYGTVIVVLLMCYCCATAHSRPQRPRSFWSAPGIETSGRSQFAEYAFCVFQPIRFVIFDNESVNRRLPVFNASRGLVSWLRPQGSRPLGTRMATAVLLLYYLCVLVEEQLLLCYLCVTVVLLMCSR